MCGLAGILRLEPGSAPALRNRVEHMIGTLRHRGPDSCGFYADDSIGLAHARLSIIDLVSGDQPIANEDETLWVVFNGEIYNYIELRKELCARGHQFRTKSDTEVILHAYEEWGVGCLSRFNGQWAFALWDRMRSELLLSRDRVGVRPLFVADVDNEILFSSEMKALFADPTVPRWIDPRGMAQVFSYWCTVAPTTMFEGVTELAPGSFQLYDRSGLKKEERYWWPPFTAATKQRSVTMADAAAALRSQLEDAVRLRMTRADVPVGSYLSGGIDSSVIARLARTHAAGDFSTYSIRFADNEFDETPFQRMMVESLGSKHHELLVTRHDIAVVFPNVVYHTEQPILRTAPAPLYLLSRHVQESGCKTVLTGEGADEFLAGYDIFREAKIRSFWARQPGSSVRPKLFDRVYPYLARSPNQARAMALEYWKIGLECSRTPGFSHERRWSTTKALQRFFSKELHSALAAAAMPDRAWDFPRGYAEWDEVAKAQYLEIETLLSGYILSSQGDRMLMAHGVEGRFPFLDNHVMDYSCSLPSLCTLPGLNEKAVLKHLGRNLVPEPIIRRPKQPYRAPDAVCFLGADAPEWIADVLSEQSVRDAGLFDFGMVNRLRRKLEDAVEREGADAVPSNNDNMALTGILSAQLLHMLFIKGTPGKTDGDSPYWRTAVDAGAGAASLNTGVR